MKRSIRFIIVLVGVLGLTLSLLVPWRFRVLERRELMEEFRREVDARTLALDREMSLHLEVLYALKWLFVGSEKVESHEFSRVADEALERHPGVMALTWVPCAGGPENQVLLGVARQEQGPENLYEVQVSIPAGEAPGGACFLAGFAPGDAQRREPFLGLDLVSNPQFMQTLQVVRDTGRMQFFGWPEGGSDVAGRQLFLALLPVFAKSFAGDTVHRDRLRGIVLGIFDYPTVFDRAGWDNFPDLSLARLVEDSGKEGLRELFVFRPDPAAPRPERFSYERAVSVNGTCLWHLQAEPVCCYLEHNLSLTPWLFVLAGLLLTLMAPFSLWLAGRHTAFIEAQVARRTRELDQANRKLASLSLTDGLTGIANRRFFDDHLKLEWNRAVREGHSLSLIMVDIDHFKAFNDHYGHLAGDDCLRQVAKALKNIASRPGDLIARYGGEEFALILPQTVSGARILGERCRAAVEGVGIPHHASPVAPVVTVSVGIASMFPQRGLDAAHLIRFADQALYRAKLLGRNQIVVEKAAMQVSAVPEASV